MSPFPIYMCHSSSLEVFSYTFQTARSQTMWLPFILATFALANTTFGAVIADRSFGATLSGTSINDKVFKAPIRCSVSYGFRRNHTRLRKRAVVSVPATNDVVVVRFRSLNTKLLSSM